MVQRARSLQHRFLVRPKGRALPRVVAALALVGLVLVPYTAHSASSGSSSIPVSGPTLSTSNRLADRRYVDAGTRAYDVGSEDGRYPAAGWHIAGEMGGIWSPPLKLLDGIWFGVNGTWLGPAIQFTSGYGYVRMDLPGATNLPQQLQVSRVDFAPDGRRAVIIGLQFTAPYGTENFTLTMDAHSELMKAYPWGWTTPNQADFNRPDSGAFNGNQLVFTENGKSPGETTPHHYAALVGSTLTPTSRTAAASCAPGSSCFRGPQDPPVVCPATGTAPYRCDDSSFGKGAGGQMTYNMTVQAKTTQTVWFVVAGSDEGLAAAKSEYAAAAANPAQELIDKINQRQSLATHTQLTLPGDPLLAQGIDWSKQNIADLHQEAQNLQLRPTNQGAAYPPPVGTIARVEFIGAGFPDYPWLFATDGEYTAFASVALGQFGPIEAHLQALRDVSDMVNGKSGKVVHETVTDGSVYYGTNSDPGNVDETVKFPSAVALVWRWTGDRSFLNNMYDFTKRTMQYAFTRDGPDMDNWLDGPGNVERGGMGAEKLDVAVYTIRGLLDLAEMAHAEGDTTTETWAQNKATTMQAAFEQAWWLNNSGTPSYADSLADTTASTLDPGAALGLSENTQLYQRYWIGVTPMEAELWLSGHTVPGLAVANHANPALTLRESACFTNGNGMFHTGTGPSDPAPDPDDGADPTCDTSTSNVPDEEDIYTLNTAVMAVGEGNYGRVGQQQQYTTANRQLQLPVPDEQPGAMPEIAPSPEYGVSIDKSFTTRAMVMQAWGAYGTAWPVVHQQLGISPDLGNGNLEVVPQVPPQEQGQTISGTNILLGSGSIDVSASAGGGTYKTTVTMHVSAHLTIGHTLPAGATPISVTLNGTPVTPTIRDTNRGREVLVDAGTQSSGTQTLVVTT